MHHVHTVKKILSDGTVKKYNYLRPPPRVAHLFAARVSLPSDKKEAEAEAVKLLRMAATSMSDGRAREQLFIKKAHDNAKSRATKKGREFTITRDEIFGMLTGQEYLCAVSRLPFSMDWDGNRNPFAPSLDRIDNQKGYTADNCRLVLSAVNFGINEWGENFYRQICRAVAQNENELCKPTVNRAFPFAHWASKRTA